MKKYLKNVDSFVLASCGVAIVIIVAIIWLLLATPVQASQTAVQPANGGTGINLIPTYGQVLLGNGTGNYTLTATSSLGLGTLFGYLFPNNATTTPLSFNGGASTTAFTASGSSYLATGGGSILGGTTTPNTSYPGTNGQQSATSFGDSITACCYPDKASDLYIELLARDLNWNLTQKAVSGSMFPDQAYYVFHTTFATGAVSTIQLGTNDSQYYTRTGSTTLESIFQSGHKDLIAFISIPDSSKVFGNSSGVAYTGTWTTGNYTFGKTSTVSGSTATFSVTGSTVLVSYEMANSATGTFSLTVDGVSEGSYTANPVYDISTTDGAVFGPQLITISGLANTAHTVVITTTNNAPTWFDWAAGVPSTIPANWPYTYVGNVPNISALGYVNYPTRTVAGTVEWNILIAQDIATMQSLGLHVFTIDSYDAINLSTDMYQDGLHPNTLGHDHLSIAWLQGINANPYPAMTNTSSVFATILSPVASVVASFESASTTSGAFLNLISNTNGTRNAGVFLSNLAGALSLMTNSVTRIFISAGGLVGIGTTTPQYQLSVNGAIQSAQGGFVFPDGTIQTSASTPYWASTNTTVYPISTASIVSIGTTSAPIANQPLMLEGSTTEVLGQYIDNDGGTPGSSQPYADLFLGQCGSSCYSISNWANAGIVESSGAGGLVLDAYAVGGAPLVLQTGRIPRIYISPLGLVGIGTTTSASGFAETTVGNNGVNVEIDGTSANVTSNVITNSSGNSTLSLDAAGSTGYSFPNWASAGIVEGGGAGGLTLDAYGGTMNFQSYRVTKMILSNSNLSLTTSLSVGSTSAPINGANAMIEGSTTEVVGEYIDNDEGTPVSGLSYPTLQLGQCGTYCYGISSWANASIVESEGTGGLVLDAYNAPFTLQISRVPKFTLTTQGYVGIGTTSPSSGFVETTTGNNGINMDIDSSSANFTSNEVTNQSGQSALYFDAGGSSGASIPNWANAGILEGVGTGGLTLDSQNAGINFQTARTTKMTLTSSGRLGIGTTSPTGATVITTAASSTPNLILDDTTNGGCIIMRDSSGSTYTELYTQAGLLLSKATTNISACN